MSSLSEQLYGEPVHRIGIVGERDSPLLNLYSNESIDGELGQRTLLFGQPPPHASAESIHEALVATEAFARKQGFDSLLGPIEGSTWHSYRAVVKQSGLTFPGDIISASHLPGALSAAGFSMYERYESAETNLADVRTAMSGYTAPSQFEGLRWKHISAADYPKRISDLYAMVAGAFAGNRLASPITQKGFERLYAQLPVGDGWLRIATLDGQEVGFALWLFGDDVAVVKTLARLPGAALRECNIPHQQLGAAMAWDCHRQFVEAGDRSRLVHALMHEHNPSARWSQRHGGRTISIYALYSKSLA